jgi:predicted Zn-dependent protease
MKKIWAKSISILLIFSLAGGCAHNSRSISRKSNALDTKEIELGESIHREVLAKLPVYSEPAVNEYVANIGKSIASHAKRQKIKYRFVILQDDRVYSMYAPGGYVYVTTGMLKFLENEIELAGVLAYEIGKLQYRDPRLSRLKKAFELMLKTGGIVAPAFGSIGMFGFISLVIVGNFVGTEKALKKQTLDADKRALAYLVESGYDPQGLIDVLRRVSDEKSPYRQSLYDYLQSHPVSEERFRRMEKVFNALPLEGKEFTSGREDYLSMTKPLRQSPASITH